MLTVFFCVLVSLAPTCTCSQLSVDLGKGLSAGVEKVHQKLYRGIQCDECPPAHFVKTVFPNGKPVTLECDACPIRLRYQGIPQTLVLGIGTPKERRAEVDDKMKRLLVTNQHFTALRMLFAQSSGELLMSSGSAFAFFDKHISFSNGESFDHQSLWDIFRLGTMAPHHGQTIDEMMTHLRSLPLGAPPLTFEMYLEPDVPMTPSDHQRWFRVEAVCMTDPVTGQLALSISLIDITDLKNVQHELVRKEKELREANKMIQRQVQWWHATPQLHSYPTTELLCCAQARQELLQMRLQSDRDVAERTSRKLQEVGCLTVDARGTPFLSIQLCSLRSGPVLFEPRDTQSVNAYPSCGMPRCGQH